MKSTGIVRKVDPLGRIVIPIEVRRSLDIEDSDGLEIYIERDRIILSKYQRKSECVFCGSTSKLSDFKSKTVCERCLSAVHKQVG
jgi:transcriptional pleiotropic regulator of transition state genes